MILGWAECRFQTMGSVLTTYYCAGLDGEAANIAALEFSSLILSLSGIGAFALADANRGRIYR